MSDRCAMCRKGRFVFIFLALSVIAVPSGSWARLGVEYQMALGNPSGATNDPLVRTNYLISRSQFVLSYNDDTHQANWVSWSYSLADDGTQSRTDVWAVEELLPSGYLKIGTSTFGTYNGISLDRGHMCPSADRTTTYNDNAVLFRMSNIIPQASSNNQGLWAQFEDYCRTLAAGGSEILIICGPSEFTGARISNQMAMPGSVWKIAVVIPNATSTTPANQRINTNCRVIAILTPNVSTGLGSWQSYLTSVEEIEAVTGFNFFSSVSPVVATYLKNVVDTGSGPNQPTVITGFSPSSGPVGTTVTINGYNFGTSPTVQFNGITTTASVSGGTTITTTVPVGAGTGPITVTSTGGADSSYEDFTVTSSGSTPTISLSHSAVSGLASTQGLAGAEQIYAVNGAYLTDDIIVTAPANFEISADGTLFSSSLTLPRAIDGTISKQVLVRIKADAPVGNLSGSITHTSNGATTRNVSVSGTVVTNMPHIIVSASSLTGFAALEGSAGSSKSYTVSAANLTGGITITASTGYEVSLDNSTFAATRTLTPVSGTIATTTVYGRLSATAPLGSNTGLISHAGGSATTQSVSVSGTVSTSGGANTDIYWDFQTAAPTSGVPANMAVVNLISGNNNGTTTLLTTTSASTSISYSSASGGNNAGAAALIGALNIVSGGSTYFEFTITPATAGIFTFAGISFGTRSTNTGPQAYAIRSSADAYATDIVTGPISNNSAWSLKSHNALNQSYSSATTFRIYGYNGNGTATLGTANWRIDDLKVSVSTGSSVTTTPVITVAGPTTATALESFSYQVQANNSPTSYAASGLPPGLTINTASGVISGTPTTPGSYIVSLTASNAGGDGTATLTINVQSNPNTPAITSNPIAYGQINTAFGFQIVASNSPTSYTAANLPDGLSINTSTGSIGGTPTIGGTFLATITALNSFGSDSKTLQIIVRVPSLTVTPETLSAFTADAGFPSATQSYILAGSELADAITVRAPQYFEISTDGVNFIDETVLTPAANGGLSQVVIVRVVNNAPPGLISGALSHSGSGAVPKYLEVSATVSTLVPTLTLSATGLANFSTLAGTASTSQTYEISGAGLTGKISISPPAGFEVGTSEGNFGNIIELSPVNGALTGTAVYVRMRADASAGTYNGNIVHSGGGAAAKTVAVSGAVTNPIGPNILATSGGSAYISASYSYTITTDGLQTVSSYGATGLPAGLSVNTTSGVISGTPTIAGTYNLTLRATGAQGTSTKAYTLRVITTSEQPSTPTVVVNKYHSSTTDRVELLVIGDTLNGPPVDLRGMTIKDLNSNMATDGGGKYVFADHLLWAKVKAGTLIVLAAGSTLSEDFDPSDFVLGINLSNPTYFTEESGGFDIGNIDMVMIKPAGMYPDGVAGGMHALAAGSAGTQYNNFTGRKVRSTRELSGFRGYFCSIVNGNTNLADFYANNAAETSTSKTFGSGNNSNNTSYVSSLRALDQDGPILSLVGSNPMNIALGSAFVDPGATATDTSGGSRTVTPSGTVNTAVAGTYVRTYTAADSVGNVTTATRTVVVDKGTPIINSLPLASSLTEGQPLLASMLRDGSATYGGAAVPGSFAWAVPSAQPPLSSSSQLVTFTPADASNYQVVTFSINVTVNSAQTPMQIWAAGFGLSQVNAEPGADPDGDGLNNAGEYAFVTSPTDGASRAVSQSSISGGIKITWLQRSGVTYVVKSGTDLKTGLIPGIVSQVKVSPQPVGLPEGVEQYEASLSGGTQGFLQVEAIIP